MSRKFHTFYSHPHPVSPAGGVSLTDAQFADECDINSILRRFGATGQLPHTSRSVVSGDFSDIHDYQACLERVNRAKSEFLALPADLRGRFGNDPSAYVDFVLDPSNQDECVRLGLRVVPEKVDTSLDVLQRIEKSLVTPKEQKTA